MTFVNYFFSCCLTQRGFSYEKKWAQKWRNDHFYVYTVVVFLSWPLLQTLLMLVFVADLPLFLRLPLQSAWRCGRKLWSGASCCWWPPFWSWWAACCTSKAREVDKPTAPQKLEPLMPVNKSRPLPSSLRPPPPLTYPFSTVGKRETAAELSVWVVPLFVWNCSCYVLSAGLGDLIKCSAVYTL